MTHCQPHLRSGLHPSALPVVGRPIHRQRGTQSASKMQAGLTPSSRVQQGRCSSWTIPAPEELLARSL
jgi:hypothetical protein